MNGRPVIVWFRRDLRLDDNPALAAAAEQETSLIPTFIWDPDGETPWSPGAASRWWLHQSLARLDSALRKAGSRLTLRTGSTFEVLHTLATETGASAVYWNRLYGPAISERDRKLTAQLEEAGLETYSFPGALLFEPGTILGKSGKPLQVFTPYWKACLARGHIREALPTPACFPAPPRWPKSVPLKDLALEPSIDWAGGMRAAWTPGAEGAAHALDRLLNQALAPYPEDRDIPGIHGTSHLSPHLHFGEISAVQVWHAVRQRMELDNDPGLMKGGEAFLRQLGWREFAHDLLVHFPHTPEAPLRESFAEFPWQEDDDALRAWHKGLTGYPLVDAGMRELWTTGWMHNRVRMVVASFLVKHLLLPWQKGAEWFWDTLVDADLANNTLGWQWAAGCGADAAPYFRVFNPVLQGQKFDPAGAYVRQWVPELARLSSRWIHAPWKAPAAALADAGITLGNTYPKPIVDHQEARNRALMAFDAVKKKPKA